MISLFKKHQEPLSLQLHSLDRKREKLRVSLEVMLSLLRHQNREEAFSEELQQAHFLAMQAIHQSRDLFLEELQPLLLEVFLAGHLQQPQDLSSALLPKANPCSIPKTLSSEAKETFSQRPRRKKKVMEVKVLSTQMMSHLVSPSESIRALRAHLIRFTRRRFRSLRFQHQSSKRKIVALEKFRSKKECSTMSQFTK